MGKKNATSGTFVVLREVPCMATHTEGLCVAMCATLLHWVGFTKIISYAQQP